MHFLTAKVMKLMNIAKADGPKSKIMKKKVNLVYHRHFQFCLLQSTKYRKIVPFLSLGHFGGQKCLFLR